MSIGAITRIQLCGQFAVVAGGRTIDDELPGRRGRLLVAFLTAHRRRAVTRADVIEALWPEVAPETAAAILTVLLSKVRALLGHDVIQGRAQLHLALDAHAAVDAETAVMALHHAESAVAQRSWKHAWGPALTAHFTSSREFLTGFDAPWITEQRANLHLVNERALAAYAEACLGIGGTELPGAERAARALIRQAPLSETGHRLLIRALAGRGDLGSAFTTYELLRQTLADELGVDPSPETRLLYRQLLRST